MTKISRKILEIADWQFEQQYNKTESYFHIITVGFLIFLPQQIHYAL